jgi:hypothetical protein
MRALIRASIQSTFNAAAAGTDPRGHDAEQFAARTRASGFVSLDGDSPVLRKPAYSCEWSQNSLFLDAPHRDVHAAPSMSRLIDDGMVNFHTDPQILAMTSFA